MPLPQVVALLGDFSSEYVDFRSIAASFGWTVTLVNDFSELVTLRDRSDIAVVVIHAKTVGTSWTNALTRVRYLVPEARVIICHGVDQAHGRRGMLDRGAYGVLRSPLDAGEVRQMLGFAWAAQNRIENGVERDLIRETSIHFGEDMHEHAEPVAARKA